MKRARYLLAGIALAVILSGCGQDRTKLASQTVQAYWTDIQHAKFNKAYDLLTPGNQAARSRSNYAQDMFGFLESTGGLTVRVGTPIVKDDLATVPVQLFSPKAPGKGYPACQHLVWGSGKWLIADESGGLTQAKDCPKA